MKRIFIAILCAVLAPALAAGQAAPPAKNAVKKKPAAARPDPRKTIGLISEIGGKFTVQQVGIMVFGNEKREESIESWGIDAIVVAKLSGTVKARFNVIPIKLSQDGKAALAAAPGSLFGDRDGHICGVLRKEAPGRSFDYYVRVRPMESAYSNTNQYLSGLGIVHRQGVDTGYTYVFALFQLEVLDGGNCSSLRHEWPAATEEGFLFAKNIHGPCREVDASWMPAKSAVVQDARLKEATESLVGNGLAQTIPQLFATQ